VAPETHVVTADSAGTLTKLDALAIGVAAWRLGAGRARKEDPVSPVAGIELHAKPGDTIAAGQPLLTLHTDDPTRFPRALESLTAALSIAEAGPSYEPNPLIIDRITA
jgi:thymidine phosphorylase